MRVSDLTKINKEYRLYRKAITLKASIERRLDWHKKHSEVQPKHLERAQEHIAYLENIIRTCEISTLLSSRQMLERNTEEIHTYIFEGLRPPGKASHDELTRILVDQMDEAGRQNRANKHKWSLMFEIAYRFKQGWFGVFNTLTVTDWAHNKVFREDSTEFKDYIRKVDRAVATEAFGNIRNAKNQEYHSYFAVIEEGGKTGRLHIHVLHLMSNLPKGTVDPNRGKAEPYLRELNSFRKMWPNGNSTPIAVRYSLQDAYGKIGYRWPLDRDKDTGIQTGSPIRIANYIGKYINKNYNIKKRKANKWRVRKTQRLGTQILHQVCNLISTEGLKLLATDPTIQPRMNRAKVPNEMIRLAALRVLQTRISSTNLLNIARDISARPSLLHALKGSIHDLHAFNQQNIISSQATASVPEDEYNKELDEILWAFGEANDYYFPRTTETYKHQSTRSHYN